MTIGVSLFLIAIGAILKFAVTLHVEGINLHTTGVILMVIGILGLILSLWLLTVRRTHPPPPEPF
jgi:formate-dependent nitrite reductase membrane component NrfD